MKRSIIQAIENVEKAHFRTQQDTGSNLNAMLIWRALRKELGLPDLNVSDLRKYNEVTEKYELPKNSRLIENLDKIWKINYETQN
jgi:hypothetical protein